MTSSDSPWRAPNGWELVLDEDFAVDAELGSFADTYENWTQYDGLQDTSRELSRPRELQGHYSSARTTQVRDGVVDIRVHTVAGTPQVMALTPPAGPSWQEGQLYGRYSVRFRADPAPGFKIAWLLWPASDEWSDGEIDFPEGELGGSIAGNAHDVTGTPEVNAWSIDTGTSMVGWRTTTIEWAPGRLTFMLDDRSWTTTDARAIPTVPMRWVLQTETELLASPPDPDVQGHVHIDRVAAWKYVGDG